MGDRSSTTLDPIVVYENCTKLESDFPTAVSGVSNKLSQAMIIARGMVSTWREIFAHIT